MTVQPGHIVRCENGHPLYRVTVPLNRRTPASHTDLVRIDEAAVKPVPGAKMERCPHCGGHWIWGLKKAVNAADDRTEKAP